jgi:TolA-binding protein
MYLLQVLLCVCDDLQAVTARSQAAEAAAQLSSNQQHLSAVQHQLQQMTARCGQLQQQHTALLEDCDDRRRAQQEKLTQLESNNIKLEEQLKQQQQVQALTLQQGHRSMVICIMYCICLCLARSPAANSSQPLTDRMLEACLSHHCPHPHSLSTLSPASQLDQDSLLCDACGDVCHAGRSQCPTGASAA